MGNGYFNADQVAHMEYLASLPPEQKCVSGWHRRGDRGCDCEVRPETEEDRAERAVVEAAMAYTIPFRDSVIQGETRTHADLRAACERLRKAREGEGP